MDKLSKQIKTRADNFTKVIAGVGNNTIDAWGKQKTTNDFSLFHGMWTFNVPNEMWLESINGIEQLTITQSESENGMLKVASNNNTLHLYSRRHPRYQPNRGYLYSTSIIAPNRTAQAIREWGVFTEESGVFFRLKADGNLYAVRRTTVDTITTDYEELIENLPVNFDVSKGNNYDIQMQWRGVGNIIFMVGSGDTGISEAVHIMDNLNTLVQLSVFNPAMSVSYRVENDGEDATIFSGCVDVTAEGGHNGSRIYSAVSTSTDSGSVALSGYNDPVIAIRINDTYQGLINTRDAILHRITGYSNQRSVIRIWNTRDSSAITATWSAINDGHASYTENGSITAFDTTKCRLLHSRRVDSDTSEEINNPDPALGEYFLVRGDIVIVTLHRENGSLSDGGVTIEWGQEI